MLLVLIINRKGCSLVRSPALGMMIDSSRSGTQSTKGKNVFVTVGTTRFDALVSSATSKIALEWMERQGFDSLTIQYGRGEKPKIRTENTHSLSTSLDIKTYDFRSSLVEDMEKADFILCHAGAGTVMEVLRLNKKCCVVINTLLMDNHQTELAGAMAERGHLIMVEKPQNLEQLGTWTSFENFSPVPYQEGDPFDMPRLLDSFLGFQSTKTE